MSGAEIVFWAFGLLSVIGALVVVRSPDPFTSVLALIVNFGSLGVIYLTLDSPFVAVAQLIVYATAVVVVFLFVVAYLGDRREILGERETAGWTGIAGLGLGALFVGLVAWATWDERTVLGDFPARDTLADTFGTTRGIAESFMTDYLLHFEVTSLVLLVAAIGGVVLALVGRDRHDRMRRLMRSESADAHKRRVKESSRRLQAGADQDGGS